MDPTLTPHPVSELRNAFAQWDTTGQGAIAAVDVCKVMEFLGEDPSPEYRELWDDAAKDEQVSFDEFVTIFYPPRWETIRPDPEGDMNKAIGAFDDGGGYAPLRDVLRIVHEHIKKSRSRFTGDDLVDVYRQEIGGSAGASVCGGLEQEDAWKVFEEEFPDLRKRQMAENGDCGPRSWRLRFRRFLFRYCRPWRLPYRNSGIKVHPCALGAGQDVDAAAVKNRVGDAGDDGDSSGMLAILVNLTVVDVGGNTLMSDTVASTWSVPALRQHIEEALGIPAHRQHLFLTRDDGCRQELCPDDACLSETGVVDGSTLMLVVRDEVKVDYKSFVDKFMDAEFQQAMARLRAHQR